MGEMNRHARASKMSIFTTLSFISLRNLCYKMNNPLSDLRSATLSVHFIQLIFQINFFNFFYLLDTARVLSLIYFNPIQDEK